ncbi:MAG: hypothetical protein SynsKO_24540 [Synoicihabitans sp.]
MAEENLHPLLARQIRKKLPGIDLSTEPWKQFLATVNETYQQADQEKEFAERTLDVVSTELTEANERIRQDAETRLSALTRYYAQTLDLQKGLLLCFRREEDGGFIHTLCRGQLCQNMGYRPERVEGVRLDKILRGPLFRRMHRIYNAAWFGKIKTLEGGSKKRGVRFLAVFHPRMENGEIIEVIVSAMEVTDLKDTESALRTAKQRAESADKAKSNFLAVMSHEIRTPMNSVIGFTSLLRTTPLSAEQAHFVKMIETSGEGLLEIINDVLDISKIEAGRMELSLEPVQTAVLAEEVMGLFDSRSRERGVELILRIDDSVPEAVQSDRARLRQILINLVGNAIKFTSKGSVTLEVSYRSDNQLVNRVIDTGIGIPPEGLERLFKPFSQVDSSTTRDFGGTGLGLAICKRLSEAMGGGIEVTSEVGKGSCFSFHIEAPVAEAEAEETGTAAVPAPESSTKREDDNPKILVVDDNPINRKVLGSMLKVAGYDQVKFEFDGAKALASVQSEMPDIIFMDVEMPVMDGMSATSAIRDLAATSATYPWIIGLSANVWPDTVRRSQEVGMNNYLSKPVRRMQIETAINERSS